MIYIVLAVAVAMAAAGGFAGFLLGADWAKPKQSDKPQAVDERAARQARIKQLELENFWSYNGDPQQSPAERAAQQQ